MSIAIQTHNLTRQFNGFTAVDRVSLSIGAGEIYGFLGLNGAGKTTTIRMLLGLIKPTGGTASIAGSRILPGGKGPWHLVGSLVETPHAYPELTVRENLEIIRRIRGITTRDAIDRIADQLKLTRYLDKKSGTLSLGNAQRLGLARALIHKPRILILDEPSNGLDPAGIVEVRDLLIDLSRNHGVTVFVSSHILDEVARLATRIGIIHDGRLLREMKNDEIHRLRRKRLLIRTANLDAAQKVLTADGHSVERIGDELAVTDSAALNHPDRIAVALVESGNAPLSLFANEESLEELFLTIIRGNEVLP